MNSLDNLAIDLWKNKYRFEKESKPEDTIKRLRTHISKELRKSLPKDARKREKEILENASEFGKSFWHSAFNDGVEYLMSQTIDWDKILPAGSALFGIGNMQANSSISNCFVIDSPHDSLEGISYRINEMRILEKARGGVGTNLSSLRPKGAVVRNQSKVSTGVCTFVMDFSQNNNIVAQDGRRGALMLCLDINHPDVCDFIELKSDLTKVTGANLSVVVDDNFMMKAICDLPHVMKFPIDSKFEPSQSAIKNVHKGKLNYDKKTNTYWKVESAKKIWNLIIHYAWECAEPGILFKDNWYKNGTDGVYAMYRPVATNPCSEIAMQPYDSCRLTSYNLVDCVVEPFTSKSHIDFERLYRMSYIQQVIVDTMIDIEISHIQNIIKKTKDDKKTPSCIKRPIIDLYNKILSNTEKGRRCGCGFMGFADMLAMIGIKFEDMVNDKEREEIIRKVFITKRNAEIDASVDLALIHSPFYGWDAEKDCQQDFFQRMFYDGSKNTLERMKKFGRRNVSFSTAAPTGTISIMAGVTSGIEPLFMPFYKRRVKVDESCTTYDYVDTVGCKFKEYMVVHQGIATWYSVINGISFEDSYKYLTSLDYDKLNDIFKMSPYYNQCANDINIEARIAAQTIVQQYTTHSISSTLNLPKEATEEQISEIYLKSWKNGLKGNTVYREGCREGIILSTTTQNSKPNQRPDSIEGVLHRLKYKNVYYAVIIGLINNKPYEIFILNRVNGLLKDLDTDIIHGVISRNSESDFDFIENNDTPTSEPEQLFEIYNLDEMEDKEQKFQSLTLSRLMRLGESMDKICEIIDKSEPISGTFTNRIQKILSDYKETKTGEKCPKCGQEMTHENGCVICKNCGYSKC